MKPKAIAVLLLLCFGGALFAQRGTVTGNTEISKLYREAEAALLQHDYKQALRLFGRCLKIQPEMVAAHRGLGLTYRLMNDYRNAATYFDKVLELDSTYAGAVFYEAAEAHYKSGNPKRALNLFERYDTLQTTNLDQNRFDLADETKYRERLAANIQACRVSLDSAKFQGIKEVVNLGGGINTRSDEYFPCLSNDQTLMFYTSRRNTQTDENLFYSGNDGRGWSNGSPFSAFNTNYHEGMSTLVRNGRTMFFTACGRDGVMGTCDIWEAEVEFPELKSAGPMNGFANSDRWDGQAAISCDGSMLFFASERPGGLGKTDLWYSKRQADGRWSDPINLGPKINTSDYEESPFITNDGKTLYFASTGHPGMGEQDIFVSWLDENGEWSTPINLGPPVNSAYRELGFFLSADGQTGYFASDRPDGFGGMDIYKFQLNEQLFSDPITFVEGQVRDSLTGDPLAVTVQIGGRGAMRTDQQGRFFLCMGAGQELFVAIQEKNYHPYIIRLPIPEWDNRKPFNLDIQLSPIRAYAARAVPEPDPIMEPKPKMPFEYTCALFFPFDSDKMDIKQTNRLDDFMRGLNGKDITSVDIIGYADDIGTDDYNLRLSEERAKNIALFMREYNIIVHKVYLKGMGEIKDDSPKSKNRRVEIRVRTLE